jgi:hypothetical protein
MLNKIRNNYGIISLIFFIIGGIAETLASPVIVDMTVAFTAFFFFALFLLRPNVAGKIPLPNKILASFISLSWLLILITFPF